MSTYLPEKGYVHLIQCFLQPGLMLQSQEIPNTATQQQMLSAHALHCLETPTDPIYKLFDPNTELGMWLYE